MTVQGHAEFPENPQLTKALAIFIVMTAVMSGLASMLVIEIGIKRYYMALLMWAPGISAMATLKICGMPPSVLGWRWGEARWQWMAYLTPVAYGLVAYGIIWGFGFGGVVDPGFIKESGYHLGLVGWSDTATLLMAIFMFGIVGIIWHISSAIGEEIGWRGFLMPALMRYMSFPLAALVTGLLWGLWHLPIILYTQYNAGPLNLGGQIFHFFLLVVSISFIAGYLRMKSGSLWTATLVHAAHNTFILGLMQRMTLQYEETWRFAGEFGMILPLVAAVFALYFWYRAHKDGLGKAVTEGPAGE